MHVVRPPPSVVRAQQREIARRYREKARRKGKEPVTFAAIRVAQLTRLIEHRHGRQLPNTDDAVLYIRPVLDHLAKLRHAEGRIREWLTDFAPWLSRQSRECLVADALDHPLRYGADKLAWKLRITAAERQALDLTTIGAIDLPKAERLEQAKQRRREREQQRRRTQGSMPRDQYIAEQRAKPKPWQRVGMSRAAWYRAGRPAPETRSVPSISL